MNAIIILQLIAALQKEVILLQTEQAQQEYAIVHTVSSTPLVLPSSSSAAGEVDAPPGTPNDPYAFNIANCPPSSTIEAVNDATAKGINAVNVLGAKYADELTASDTAYCGMPIAPRVCATGIMIGSSPDIGLLECNP